MERSLVYGYTVDHNHSYTGPFPVAFHSGVCPPTPHPSTQVG